MDGLKGKVALVTGASRELGKAIAERLCRDGASVVVNYYPSESQDAEKVVQGKVQGGGSAIAAEADISESAQMRGLFDFTEKQFGHVDILVLNAAVIPHDTIIDTTDEIFDKVFATNTRASFIALREAAIRIPDGGRVVAISAGLTRMPTATTGIYAASKAAVEHLVRVLAHEVGARGITFNSVLPGATLTPALINVGQEFIDREIAKTPLGRVGEPEDIADIVGFLVSEQGRWITGQSIGAGGGMF
ncbi:3-oxoacyl-[acyl-carrier protein] reductase [Paenibacillus sp. yr247]|uniref:SDR family oxidoreductase n=1 Tax=Paenibacillus sp. yr247 TaxID=1761880 RepID=UPI000883D105|nr:SDR family oxidoreductase [Paenibacillus sp. yr247]SDO84719.1 3-oxoacyl-[acyl-carrier protein] reductase [Paenibacillus sp. yr247]